LAPKLYLLLERLRRRSKKNAKKTPRTVAVTTPLILGPVVADGRSPSLPLGGSSRPLYSG
jgi:hypothetical protein